MADLQRRRTYSPRQAREKRAYQLVVGGGVAGAVAILGLVLAIAGVVSAALPVIALIVAIICLAMFRRMVNP